MRKVFLEILALLFVLPAVFAQQLSQQEAQKIASTFFKSCGKLVKNSVELKWVYSGGSPINPDYFVFNANQRNGFVIIAADKRASDQIFAYSFTGSFDANQIPDAFKAILDSYSESIQTIRLKGGNDRTATLRNTVSPALKAVTQVGPLLDKIAWHQEAPFNEQCPGQTLTGCGATASAQLMRFYKWPLTGNGSYDGIDYGSTKYNWDLMLETYGTSASKEQKDEVAKLMHHVGVAEKMNYSLAASGTSIENIANALVQYFRYADKIQRAYRFSYTDKEWFNLIKREIDLGRPIIYAGSDKDSNGHLFVCDGYDSDGKLHMNFGWGGYQNAFLSIANITYVRDNRILTSIYPADKTVSEADQGLHQVTMVTPLNSSSYSMKTGEKFNIGLKIANYSQKHTYNGVLGITLFKDGKQIGEPLAKTATLAIKGSNPASSTSEGILETDVMIKNVVIPSGTADGNYQLRLVVRQGSEWMPALSVMDYAVKELNVVINQGKIELSYPLSNDVLDLRLETPIQVSMALNRATVKFSVRNFEDDYDVNKTMIYVMANTDNQLVPTVWKSVEVDNLLKGQTKTFEISDIPMPANSTQCRFYVAYNRAKILPTVNYQMVAATPMMPAGMNFYNYTLQNEAVNTVVDFVKNDIPSSFKKYLKNGTIDAKSWKGLMGYATISQSGRLVTNPIKVTEYSVLEWEWNNMYSGGMDYIVAVSTEGQDFENFENPVFNKFFAYNKELKSTGKARMSLAEYAGKEICISFSNSKEGEYGLQYFKILEIVSPKDISVESIDLPGTVTVGQSVPVKIQVKNFSGVNVKKVMASYTYQGTIVEEVIDTDIAFAETKELAFKTPIIIKGISGDSQEVKVTVKQDGELAAQMTNNEKTMKIQVADFYSKKNLLIFKASKLQCPGCMQAYNKLSEIEDAFPGVVIPLELWRDGGFYSGDEYKNYTMGTTPTYFIDGQSVYNGDAVFNKITESYSSMSAPASVAVDANYENAESRKLKIKVKSTFALPLPNSTYRLGAIIIENNVVDANKQTYGSRPADFLLRKDHIVVGVIGGITGAAGMEIKNPQATAYTYDCEFEIPQEISAQNRYCKDDIQVIGVLYDGQGNIVNSALSSYYLKLPKTSGLTFKAQDNAPEFKHLYELESLENYAVGSVETYRAILPVKGTFRFKVEKDASLAGKAVKLIVNKEDRLKGVEAGEELLLPDENGIYSITDAQKHYLMTIRIEKEVDFPATVTKNGTVWSLSGTWKPGDFTTVLGSVDAKVTGLDMSNIVIPADAAVLNTSNPNILIFVSEGTKIPEAWMNYNIVQGDNMKTLNLIQGKPFNVDRTFDAVAAIFKGSYPKGFSTICLPYDLEKLPDGVKAEEFTGYKNAKLEFREVLKLNANTPYLLSVDADVANMEFKALNAVIQQVKATEPGIISGDYVFKYTYSNLTGTEIGDRIVLVPTTDGKGFTPLASATRATDAEIPAFSAYIEYLGTGEAPSPDMEHSKDVVEPDPKPEPDPEHPTNIDKVLSPETFELFVKDQVLTILSGKAKTIYLIELNGRINRTVKLVVGTNKVYGVESGVYIIEKHKVVVR